MTDKRYYQKGNPDKEPLQSVKINTKKVSSDKSAAKFLFRQKYTKPDAFKHPQKLVVVYSGGTEREKDYFRLIDKNPTLFPVRIDFYADPNFEKGGRPSIVQFAKDKTDEYKESASEENPDSYFLLTDVDHFERFLREMKIECEENDIELIISNSCFEVWLYYAEKSDRCSAFNVPENKMEVSSAFKTWANAEVKGGLKPTKAILNIEQNIENAKKNYEEEDGFPNLFSTQMFRLAEHLLPFVKNSLKFLR